MIALAMFLILKFKFLKIIEIIKKRFKKPFSLMFLPKREREFLKNEIRSKEN